MPSPTPYCYDILSPESIRILVLEAGSYSDPLRARLETAFLDDKPHYRAISYAWGPAVCPNILYLGSNVLHITESLHGALRRFRGPVFAVKLWADAVCINQNDVPEREAQVAIMERIYSEADHVLVWLGEASASTALAFRMIELLDSSYVSAQANETQIESAFVAQIQQRPTEWRCGCCGEAFNLDTSGLKQSGIEQGSDALNTIWERPWFMRLWVVQETVLARALTFYHGPHRASADSVLAAMNNHYGFRFGSVYDSVELVRQTFAGPLGILMWLEGRDERDRTDLGVPSSCFLLMKTSQAAVKEPRDRVYALRALLESCPEVEDAVLPDYKIDLRKLWTLAALMCLRSSDLQSLAFALAGLQRNSGRTAGLPTWVPDFNTLDAECRRKAEVYVQRSNGQVASGPFDGNELRFHAVHDPASGLLLVEGFRPTTIASISAGSELPVDIRTIIDPDDQDSLMLYLCNYLLPWYLEVLTFAINTLPRASTALGQHQSFLQHGWHIDSNTTDGDQRHTEYAKAIAPMLLNVSAMDALGGDTPSAAQIATELFCFLEKEAVLEFLDRTRILASTTDHHLAWVPGDTRPGDAVCIFAGTPNPFVLRLDGHEEYEMIGDAYVQGMMDGEVWPESADDPRMEMVRLR
ncbi:hypothetical protein LTR17_000540 [Elasticomyces elasticus]|nr:hypothetical protein LTR17_000540 [Elasticomyces elasticus]